MRVWQKGGGKGNRKEREGKGRKGGGKGKDADPRPPLEATGRGCMVDQDGQRTFNALQP